MRHYDVVISDKAKEDMDAIYKYIAETLHEPSIAAKQYNRIADAILTLEEMLEMDEAGIAAAGYWTRLPP